jgi:serine/threonine protein kinase
VRRHQPYTHSRANASTADALFSDLARTHVKLVDFGVSKFAQAPQTTALDKPGNISVAGSPAYMAPELLPSGKKEDEDEDLKLEDGKVGYACDVWSLGAFALLCQ